MPLDSTQDMLRNFSTEYNSQESVRKYSFETAGHGINYLLRNEYARIYLEALELIGASARRPLHVLEFGCGAGMNIIGLLGMLDGRKIPIGSAWGTDFSPTLIDSAKQEARRAGSGRSAGKIAFHVARNEQLIEDLSKSTLRAPKDFESSFDLIFGVNTIRYCHRLGKQLDCARDIARLLRSGGVSVVIDMNDRFPAFRSHLMGSAEDPAETYLPSLEEYTAPFEAAGFEIVSKRHFCWIPHSAGPALTRVCRVMTPLLNTVARSRAMRSLVIARKP